MKTIALVSGGKDSILAVLMAYRYGHEPAVIVNIVPALPGDLETAESETALGHDIDSYMYQTVGFEAVDSIAACMNVPLRRACVKRGHAKDQSLLYSEQPPEDDEVESLFRLLRTVKEEFPEVQGLTSGAILSNYQRNRVEFICDRLGIESLAYLWMRQPGEILDMANRLSVHAILIKTASIGLVPRKLIGKTLEEARATLETMAELYQSHLAGEGGEYETTVLNCPLFLHEQLVVTSLAVVMQDDNDISPCGHGVLTVRREAKPVQQQAVEKQLLRGLREGRIDFPSDVMPLLLALSTSAHEPRSGSDSGELDALLEAASWASVGSFALSSDTLRPGVESQTFHGTVAVTSSGGEVAAVRSVVEACFTAAQAWAVTENLCPFYYHCALASPSWEAASRAAYSATVSHVCPPGLLVTVRKSGDNAHVSDSSSNQVVVEVLAAPSASIQKNVLHSQSRSCWALGDPGPYAQGRRVVLPSGDALVFISATAGRVPATRNVATARDLPESVEQRLAALLVQEEAAAVDAAAEVLFALANCQRYLSLYRRTLQDVTRATVIITKCVPPSILPLLWRWCVGESAAPFEQVCRVAAVSGLSAGETVRIMVECSESVEE
ncbi:hypothetical protein ABL78_1603 [Leptomonas seymouri]|uniref:Diphthine--ammonia ligase n=1 Tax=Leptomonas seymouri TaxID=5684 RepID=A0A0N1PEV4_LEPSE|nr:hypothetical protein ABL78_1603 [Leptomonas seymouri]|eukprot:KPI89270.1 hypothetical protein ABL78_1603 [Leptomonas seymouri]